MALGTFHCDVAVAGGKDEKEEEMEEVEEV